MIRNFMLNLVALAIVLAAFSSVSSVVTKDLQPTYSE